MGGAGGQEMRLKENIDIIAFLKSVRRCREDVYYDSPEGDHLDLKSALSQYVLTANIRNPQVIQKGDIRCSDEKDYERLKEYLVF